MIKAFSLMCMILILAGCNDRDGQPLSEVPFFTILDLNLLHDGRSKTWFVKNFYSDYANNEISPDQDCILDDTYTFYESEGQGRVELGDNSCFWVDPDGQSGFATYTYYETAGELFLDHGRTEQKGAESSSSLQFLKLRSISYNEAIFANGTEDNWGTALILGFE